MNPTLRLPTNLNGARLDVPAGFRVVHVSVEFGTVVVELAVEPKPTTLEPTYSEYELARDGQKIAAIKAYRTRTGAGLREAKDAIERVDPNFRPAGPIGY